MDLSEAHLPDGGNIADKGHNDGRDRIAHLAAAVIFCSIKRS